MIRLLASSRRSSGVYSVLSAARAVEWRTVAVAAMIYGGWVALTWWHTSLPTPLVVILGAGLVAWHGSLQHETIHGHPTRWGRVNASIGFVPLSLWLPYAIYWRSHLAHHASPWITHPRHDPESRYLASDSGVGRWLGWVQRTLVGRLAFGPLIAVVVQLREEGARARVDAGAVIRDWVPHLVAVVLILFWLDWTGFGIGRYLLLVVYPGTALTLLRSFAEHRADIPGPARAATVERGGLLGLLFLNNHLHAAHHERPDLAWHRLPAYQRHHRARLISVPAQSYCSYGEIFRRFALRSHHVLVHPDNGVSP